MLDPMEPGQCVHVSVRGGEVVLDATRLPIVVATWSGEADIKLVDGYFYELRGLLDALERSGRQALMLTLTEFAGRPSPVARQRITEHTTALRGQLSRVFFANAVVVHNPVIRGALTALGWIDPDLRVPYLPDLETARKWAQAQLATLQLEFPPGALAATPTNSVA